MQAEDWSRAREAAVRAAELDPLCPNVLFRLSACYGQEKDFVNAHLYCERALALLSPQERIAHLEKFKRLQEQSKDVLDNVYREDPFDVLPLEVLLNILQFALEKDPYAALRASWVNRRWRNTINHNCPELWKIWTVSHTSLLSGKSERKQAVWLERSGGHFDTLQLRDISLSAASKVGKRMLQNVKAVRRVDLRARDRDALARLVRRIPADTFEQVESVSIALKSSGSRHRGGYMWQDSSFYSVTCGLSLDNEKLRDIELENLNFVPSHRRPDWNAVYPPRRRMPTPEVVSYPALSRLIVRDCAFDDDYAQTIIADGTVQEFQADVLHTLLRGASNLESLDVAIYWDPRRSARPAMAMPITLPLLRSCRLPPPSCWSIDIVAPNLECLAFTLESKILWGGSLPEDHEGRPLIPLPQSYPLTDNLFTLKSFDVLCGKDDDISRFRAWIPRLQSAESVTIRDLGNWPYPEKHPWRNRIPSVSRVATAAIGFLNDNPLSCPKMQSLELESCFTPGKVLVSWIRQRRSLTGCAAIERLILTECSALSEYAKLVLKQEVAHFEVRKEFSAYNKELKQILTSHLDDDFEVDAPAGTESADSS